MLVVVNEELKLKQNVAGDYPLGDVKCSWMVDSNGDIYLEEEGYKRAHPMEMSDWPFESDLLEMQRNGARGTVTVADTNENTLTLYSAEEDGVYIEEPKIMRVVNAPRKKL